MDLLIPPVSKTLTKTMIDKGNPDCFKELVRLARLLGVDFDAMTNGNKKELPLHFPDGTETTIKFYVVTGKNGRKDKRYNIPAPVLREQAAERDASGNVMLCANVTRNPEYSHLTTDEINVTALQEAV